MKRQWLKEARNAKLMSQHELAVAIGATKAAVQNWESGKSQPYPRHQKALSELLGIDVHAALQSEGQAVAS